MVQAVPEFLAHYAKLFHSGNGVLRNHSCFSQTFVVAFFFRCKLLRFDAALSTSRAFSFERDSSVELGKIFVDALITQIDTNLYFLWQTGTMLLKHGIVVSAASGMSGFVDEQSVFVYWYLSLDRVLLLFARIMRFPLTLALWPWNLLLGGVYERFEPGK